MRYIYGAVLTLGLCGMGAAAFAQDATSAVTFSDAQKEAIRTLVRETLVQKPELVLEAIQSLEAKQKKEAALGDKQLIANNAKAIFDNPQDFSISPKGYDITIVEFSDYRCGYCRKAHSAVEELLKSDSKIRFVVKELPVLGPASVYAAKVSLAALAQDRGAKYQKFASSMINFPGDLNEGTVRKLVKEAGFDWDKIDKEIKKPEIEAMIKANYDLATVLGINGTPGFVVGDELVRGYMPVEAMQALVAQKRKK